MKNIKSNELIKILKNYFIEDVIGIIIKYIIYECNVCGTEITNTKNLNICEKCEITYICLDCDVCTNCGLFCDDCKENHFTFWEAEKCYFCNKQTCKVELQLIKLCSNRHCYHCIKGQCFNNISKMVCTNCYESDYCCESDSSDNSDNLS